MKQHFQGWDVVGQHLERLAAIQGGEHWSLNAGQCASLRGIRQRIPHNGVVIADEVGMGKTRIAVALAHSVIAAGGRVAILVPPGLGFQWHDELRDGGVDSPPLLRSLWQFLAAWDLETDEKTPWFDHKVILISHAFTNWRLGENNAPWRWALLPTLYGRWRKFTSGRFPNGFGRCEELDDEWVQAAACAIAETIQARPVRHPARRLLDELCRQISWAETLNPSGYGRGQTLRPWLESAVGLGLGIFDLVIIDEAHKSRGDHSGLSRMLDQVVIPSDSARRLAMTATPVELDASQWSQILGRIGASGFGNSTTPGERDIFQDYADACAHVRQRPHDTEAREAYCRLAQRFEQTLQPYVLRRDKLELASVKDFAEHSGLAPHAYRDEREIAVDTARLDLIWRQAVCAAEALSVVTRQAEDAISKRLRLTLGNGHGVAMLLDHVKRDDHHDQQQMEHDREQGINIDESLQSLETKRQQRAVWWKGVITNAFSTTRNPLFDHPAILAAVEAIEEVTGAGEKVLVFGRFTLPLQALVAILNARALLRALESGEHWGQAKIHEDEWPAVQAAHRQLKRPGEANREALDRRLAEQYRKLERYRRKSRDSLIDLLDTELKNQRSRAVFQAFREALGQPGRDAESPLALMAKALTELTGLGSSASSDSQIALAFEELIEAVYERGDVHESLDADMDAEDAAELWALLHDRLACEYNRPEGGFARLMYGGTAPETRRLLQLAFNRPHSNPRVLVAQSLVGREGLNLHKACRTVVLLHPEWNPGVVEQQIGRVDRVSSRWEHALREAIDSGQEGECLPRILVRPVIFRGTYDEKNWDVLRERWDDLRAQLHGVVISPQLSKASGLSEDVVKAINDCAPRFTP